MTKTKYNHIPVKNKSIELFFFAFNKKTIQKLQPIQQYKYITL